MHKQEIKHARIRMHASSHDRTIACTLHCMIARSHDRIHRRVKPRSLITGHKRTNAYQHARMHTSMHEYIPACTHTQTSMHACTHTDTPRVRAYGRACPGGWARVFIRICAAHGSMRAGAQARMGSRMHLCSSACACACACAYAGMCICVSAYNLFACSDAYCMRVCMFAGMRAEVPCMRIMCVCVCSYERFVCMWACCMLSFLYFSM